MTMHNIASAQAIDTMPKGKARLNDGGGLFVRQKADGSKQFSLDYKFRGKSRSIVLGYYPDIDLVRARQMAADVRAQVENDIDPVTARRSSRANPGVVEDAFNNMPLLKDLTKEWLQNQSRVWSPEFRRTEFVRLNSHVLKFIGKMRVADIEPKHVASVLRRLLKEGKIPTAIRTRRLISRVMDYAVCNGIIKINPCDSLRSLIPKAPEKNRAAVTRPADLKSVLLRIEDFRGTFVVKCAIKLTILTLLRSIELRGATWDEFDLDKKVWRVPSERMKRDQEKKLNSVPHVVPLSDQAVQILKQLWSVTGPSGYVFRGQGRKSPYICGDAINKALRSVGIDTKKVQCAHGFRATARTMLVEQLNIPESWVEMQLDHEVSDANGHSYNRTKLIHQRIKMMQLWADYLDEIRAYPGDPPDWPSLEGSSCGRIEVIAGGMLASPIAHTARFSSPPCLEGTSSGLHWSQIPC